MTRSFDRRTFAGPPYVMELAMSVGLDCSCENNDPDCATCWEPVAIPSLCVKGPKPQSQFDTDVRFRFDECLELLLRKHKDYGPSNIGNAPGGALNGLRVRLHDKMARVNHLIDTGATPENESLRDSFADIVNYGIISLLFLDGAWPTE